MEDKLTQDGQGFYIDSEIERLNYLITASEENTGCYVSIITENKEEVYSFNSQMFLTDQEDLELTWENPSDIKLELIKPNCVVKIEYDLHGIKTNAECFLRSLRYNGDNIILNISGPYKMLRVQRRRGQRVGLNSKFQAFVHLDKRKQYLSNLAVINISDGGAALLVSAPPEDIRKNLVFDSSEILLPLKANNHFITGMKVCHIKPISKSLLPASIRDGGNYPWVQVGIKFMVVSQKMEQSLAMVMNQLLRNGS